MKTATENLYALLDRLRQAKIHYQMCDRRDGAVSIDVTVPGERWEIDMLADGAVEIEVFKSDGAIHDEAKLAELFERFSD
jgi:hypothetical protein